MWWRISLQTFGGPAGQIAVLHRELVDERRWIGEQRFLHALSYCTLLPGPEAQQLATYLGWLLNGTIGGLVAGISFVLPGYLAVMALSIVYAGWGDSLGVQALLAGVSPAVVAVVADALRRVAGRALDSGPLRVIAAGSFVGLAAFGLAYPIVLCGAAVAGLLLRSGGRLSVDDGVAVVDDHAADRPRRATSHTLGLVVAGLIAWVAPVGLAAVVLGRSSIFVEQGLFFGSTAVVTFGGAYAVLGFVAQRAVETYGWLGPRDMIAGLALAETTPGPLIMVVQFVGFLGAYRRPGALDPWLAGVLAATLVTWVTFVPSLLLVLVGAPYVEALRGNRRLAAALRGVTAAVVGVIANLALYFGMHVLFDVTEHHRWGPARGELPVLSSVDVAAVAIALLAALVVIGRRWSVLRTLALCGSVGAALHVLGR